MMKLTTLITCLCVSAVPAHALNYYDDDKVEQTNEQVSQYFTQGQLAQILAPIALYPDTLLTHILIAASYPLEVVEAYRWQQANQTLSKRAFTNALEKQNWDQSVKALVPFEKVLGKMHEDLSWMRDIGDAFLAQETEVLETIQTLRQQAYEAGSLDELDNTRVDYDNEKIVIVSNQPEVIYVPYYDTRVVYGHWRWHHYPPRYWHISHRYYHPVAWHAGVHIGLGFYFSAFHWHHGYVVVNHHRSHYHRKRHHIIHSGYTKRWHHKPHHRKNVAYRTAVVKDKYRKHVSHGVRYSKQRNTAKLVRATKPVNQHRTYKKLANSHTKSVKTKHDRTTQVKVKSKNTKQTKVYRNNKKREQAIEHQYRKSTDRQFTAKQHKNSHDYHSKERSQTKAKANKSVSRNKVRTSSNNTSGKAKSSRNKRQQ